MRPYNRNNRQGVETVEPELLLECRHSIPEKVNLNAKQEAGTDLLFNQRPQHSLNIP